MPQRLCFDLVFPKICYLSFDKYWWCRWVKKGKNNYNYYSSYFHQFYKLPCVVAMYTAIYFWTCWLVKWKGLPFRMSVFQGFCVVPRLTNLEQVALSSADHRKGESSSQSSRKQLFTELFIFERGKQVLRFTGARINLRHTTSIQHYTYRYPQFLLELLWQEIQLFLLRLSVLTNKRQ